MNENEQLVRSIYPNAHIIKRSIYDKDGSVLENAISVNFMCLSRKWHSTENAAWEEVYDLISEEMMSKLES
jgi:hypothetical protein